MSHTEAKAALRYALDASMILGEVPTVTYTGGYAKGISIYDLGLIHGSRTRSLSEKKGEAWEFLRGHLRASHANEVIIHWADLGVGLTDLVSTELGIVNDLKELLYTKSAMEVEASGMAIGMVLVLSGAGNATSSSSALEAANSEELLEVVSEIWT